VKGAPEKLWALSQYILVKGENQPIDAGVKKDFDQANERFGKNGERVLGFA